MRHNKRWGEVITGVGPAKMKAVTTLLDIPMKNSELRSFLSSQCAPIER